MWIKIRTSIIYGSGSNLSKIWIRNQLLRKCALRKSQADPFFFLFKEIDDSNYPFRCHFFRAVKLLTFCTWTVATIQLLNLHKFFFNIDFFNVFLRVNVRQWRQAEGKRKTINFPAAANNTMVNVFAFCLNSIRYHANIRQTLVTGWEGFSLKTAP